MVQQIGTVRMVWSGLSGGEGLSQFHFLPQTGDITSTMAGGIGGYVRGLFSGFASSFPSNVALDVQPQVDVQDVATGQLLGTIAMSSDPAIVQGTGTGAFAEGTGFKIVWETNVVKDGRRVRGRTYVCPAMASAFDATGRVNSSTTSGWATPIANYLTGIGASGGTPVVWSRPSTGNADGSATIIASGAVSPRPARLRGRTR